MPKWTFILIGTIVVALLAFFYSSFMMDPVYVAQGRLYITGSATTISSGEKEDTDLSDLMISQELSRTYGQFLTSNTFFKNVAKESKVGLSYESIKKMTKISNVENTGILQVSVSSTDPRMASKLANTILKCAPKEIERIIVAGSASIIELAETPKRPSSPNKVRNSIIGALAGLVVSILIVFLQNMFDKSIKSADEIKEIFGLPVLGMVPVIEPHHEKEEGGETDAPKASTGAPKTPVKKPVKPVKPVTTK